MGSRGSLHCNLNCIGKIIADGVLLPSSNEWEGHRFRIQDVQLNDEGLTIDNAYFHGNEVDGYQYLQTVRMTDEKWLAVLFICWIAIQARTKAGALVAWRSLLVLRNLCQHTES